MDELKNEVLEQAESDVAPVEAVEETVSAEAVEETAPAEAAAETAPAQAAQEEAPAQAEEEAAPVPEEQTDAAPAAEEAPAPEEKEADAPSESMDDYATELEASFRKINEGDKLTGTVISVTDDEIIVDLGYYTDGIIRLDEASDDPSFSLKDRVQVGQKITATVVRKDDGAGHILLSMREAAQLMAWDRLKELKETGANVSVKISGVTKAGAIANLEGMRAFIPASKLSLGYVEEDDLANWIGKSIETRVIEAEQEGKKLILSAKEILREKQREERKARIAGVEVGTVTEGKVETIKPYGAFVNLGDGLSGLVHVSQISQKRIKDPGEVLKEGDTVKVKIIANKDGKISLSMKVLEEAPVQEVREERVEIPKSEKLTTSLGDLFAKLKL
ncbi:MAG: S1 RNA-binding domain-containing protein [Lachnospiraceae bacterium]|nr:S1 RNA-binding domain-containing protein [Lachnospiraceae bacterium]